MLAKQQQRQRQHFCAREEKGQTRDNDKPARTCHGRSRSRRDARTTHSSAHQRPDTSWVRTKHRKWRCDCQSDAAFWANSPAHLRHHARTATPLTESTLRHRELHHRARASCASPPPSTCRSAALGIFCNFEPPYCSLPIPPSLSLSLSLHPQPGYMSPVTAHLLIFESLFWFGF